VTISIEQAIAQTTNGENLTSDDMADALGHIMDGGVTDEHIAAFLTALHRKGETVDEIVGAVRAMRARVLPISIKNERILDTCGTGGDGASTFNISTAVAFVCATAGVTVAKHGNRAISSKVGSADVLEAMGVALDISAEAVTRCIEQIGVGFMFAPHHHSALRHAAAARRQLGFRTVLNLLGPMTNPAAATHQLVGVFDIKHVTTVAEVLGRLGARQALVVHGADGLDEISLSTETHAALWRAGRVEEMTITPEQFGVPRAPVEELRGSDADTNGAIIRQVLGGHPGPTADVVRLNAGAALWVAEAADSLQDGVDLATTILDSGDAGDRLNDLIYLTQALSDEGV
jgi:anthranilate phosphoribosyltransferase